MAGLILLLGGAAAGLASLIVPQLSRAQSTILVLVVLSIEPWLLARDKRRSGQDSAHDLHRGRMGIVTLTCAPTGRVTVDGASWAARSVDEDVLQPGECVFIHGGQSLLLHVSRREPKAE
jgi:membrane protein implicated in regulation of membrane protease activity